VAVLVHLTQTAQDEETVSYSYGPTPEDQPHSLTIDKASGRLRDSTDPDDRLVAGWLGHQRQTRGRWLERGILAS
jgi:hypothetical protein